MAVDDRAGAVELLGVVAYGELAGFDRMAADARMAPELSDRVRMTAIAVTQFEHFQQLTSRLSGIGADPMLAMEPYHRPFDEFHDQTRPRDWYEGLLKAYLSDGLAADFYREIADLVDADTKTLVHEALADAGHADFVVDRVRTAIESDPDLAGRLALWGRRLVGEAMSQAHRVIADRPALADLLADQAAGRDLADIGHLFTRLIQQHTARMARLGLGA